MPHGMDAYHYSIPVGFISIYQGYLRGPSNSTHESYMLTPGFDDNDGPRQQKAAAHYFIWIVKM